MTDSEVYLLEMIGLIAGVLVAYKIYELIDDIRLSAIVFE